MKKTYQQPQIDLLSFTSVEPIAANFDMENGSISIEGGWGEE